MSAADWVLIIREIAGCIFLLMLAAWFFFT